MNGSNGDELFNYEFKYPIEILYMSIFERNGTSGEIIGAVQSTAWVCTRGPWRGENTFSSWKKAKGVQIALFLRPSAKLLEGYSAVNQVEQACCSVY